MSSDLIPRQTAPTWELVEDAPPTRMFTAAELERLQGFPAPDIFFGSMPCALFAAPKKPRIA